MKKKIKKKTVQSRLCDVGHVSRADSIPPFEPAGMKKKTKKKMRVGHFGKIFSKGVRLEIFFANRVRKKKFLFFCGGRDLNPEPCIFYALSIPTELNSREQLGIILKSITFTLYL